MLRVKANFLKIWRLWDAFSMFMLIWYNYTNRSAKKINYSVENGVLGVHNKRHRIIVYQELPNPDEIF